jgi:hypothetical protein
MLCSPLAVPAVDSLNGHTFALRQLPRRHNTGKPMEKESADAVTAVAAADRYETKIAASHCHCRCETIVVKCEHAVGG